MPCFVDVCDVGVKLLGIRWLHVFLDGVEP